MSGDKPGVCVIIHKCLSSRFIDLAAGQHPPICGFQGRLPVVCCTDCKLVDDTRNIIVDFNLGLLHKTGHKSNDACLELIHKTDFPCKIMNNHAAPRFWDRTFNKTAQCFDVDYKISDLRPYIISSNAERAQFPHMALLGFGEHIDDAQWLCGGSLISEWYILTAGHCLSQPQLGPVKYVALGMLKRSDPPEIWQKYHVKRIIPHPEYKPPSKYNDIALLQTTTEIKFGDDVRPACLHTKGEPKYTLSGTGWGAQGYKRPLADVLQAAYINRFEEEVCLQHYPPHRHLKHGYNHTTQMCYGDTESVKNSCQGDSGGPLQSLNYDELGCVFTIVGVTSAGKQCGISAGSGLYTRVYHYVPWIESVVWP